LILSTSDPEFFDIQDENHGAGDSGSTISTNIVQFERIIWLKQYHRGRDSDLPGGKVMNASVQIDEMISGLTDWRGKVLAKLRRIIHEADPEIIEEWKWRGAPVFSDHGIVCVANAFRDKVKVTFYDGASLPDPHKLFNSGLDGKKWRTIDLYEGDKVNESALKVLVRAGVDFNKAKGKKKAVK
jgi:hypothetical protein